MKLLLANIDGKRSGSGGVGGEGREVGLKADRHGLSLPSCRKSGGSVS